MPIERLAQLDRLAEQRGVTRSRLVREAIDGLLDDSSIEPTPDETAALERRRQEDHVQRRVGDQPTGRSSHRRGRSGDRATRAWYAK